MMGSKVEQSHPDIGKIINGNKGKHLKFFAYTVNRVMIYDFSLHPIPIIHCVHDNRLHNKAYDQ